MSEKNKNRFDQSRPFRGTGGIFLIGFMGSGKTYWAKQLGQKLQIPYFDLDEQIEESEGATIAQIFAQQGEEAFRQKEKEALHLLAETHETFVMATGGGTPCFFNNIDYMNKVGTTVWINPSIESLHKRLLKEKTSRPLLKGLDDDGLKAFIIRKLGDRKIFYQQAKEILFEEDLNIDTFLEKLFHIENN